MYGLKYNSFLPDVPPGALFTIPGTEPFALRVETMDAQIGFALIARDPGVGKSKPLQQIAHRLEQVPDLTAGVMQRPQSALGDFYRELGELFNAGLSVANRCGSGITGGLVLPDEISAAFFTSLRAKRFCSP